MTDENKNIQHIVEQTINELDKHTQKELEKACQLRKKIGLADIAKTKISTSLYSGHGIACVRHNAKTEEIYMNINLIPYIAKLNKGKKGYLETIHYFSLFRDLIGLDVGADIILPFISQENPDLKSLIISSSKDGEEKIKKLESQVSAAGVKLEDCFRFIDKNAETIRKNLENALPEMKKQYKESSIVPTLLHELDHIDCMNTDLYRDIIETEKSSIEKIGKGKHIKDFAEARLELLEKESEVLPLLETRGIIYDFMAEYDCIEEYDYIEECYINKLETNTEEIAGKVIDRFIKGYVNNEFLDKMVECVVLKEWAEGNMDQVTSNYISGRVKMSEKLEKESRDSPKPEGVNPEVADRVLYTEIPKWKKKFTDNAIKTTEASINAMVHNPEGFEKARSAKTLDQYISLLAT